MPRVVGRTNWLNWLSLEFQSSALQTVDLESQITFFEQLQNSKLLCAVCQESQSDWELLNFKFLREIVQWKVELFRERSPENPIKLQLVRAGSRTTCHAVILTSECCRWRCCCCARCNQNFYAVTTQKKCYLWQVDNDRTAACNLSGEQFLCWQFRQYRRVWYDFNPLWLNEPRLLANERHWSLVLLFNEFEFFFSIFMIVLKTQKFEQSIQNGTHFEMITRLRSQILWLMLLCFRFHIYKN